MLFLLFQIGNDRYALEARHAVEVIPFLALKKIPRAPRGMAGIFNYRGRPVPAVDLCALTFGRPARELLSTRIIVINFTSPAGLPESSRPLPPPDLPPHLRGEWVRGVEGGEGHSQWLGLIAEHATGMMRREARDFVSAGVKVGDAPYLGPVVLDEKGVIQLLHAEHLLTETMHELLYSELPRVTHERD